MRPLHRLPPGASAQLGRQAPPRIQTAYTQPLRHFHIQRRIATVLGPGSPDPASTRLHTLHEETEEVEGREWGGAYGPSPWPPAPPAFGRAKHHRGNPLLSMRRIRRNHLKTASPRNPVQPISSRPQTDSTYARDRRTRTVHIGKAGKAMGTRNHQRGKSNLRNCRICSVLRNQEDHRANGRGALPRQSTRVLNHEPKTRHRPQLRRDIRR